VHAGLIGTVSEAARFLDLHHDPAHPGFHSETAVIATQPTTSGGRKLDVGLASM
jgi:hypothetical protein